MDETLDQFPPAILVTRRSDAGEAYIREARSGRPQWNSWSVPLWSLLAKTSFLAAGE